MSLFPTVVTEKEKKMTSLKTPILIFVIHYYLILYLLFFSTGIIKKINKIESY